jgi:hypothetical protein
LSDAPSAVKLFAFEHPSLVRSLRGKLTARRAELLGQIVSAQSWDDFKQRVGVIRGLDDALGICDDVDKQLEN